LIASKDLKFESRMKSDKTKEIVEKHCGPAGLNLIRGLGGATADEAIVGPIKTGHLLAGAKSVIIIGNYGPEMWEKLQSDIERNREFYDAINDPVDVFSSRAIESAVDELKQNGLNAVGVYPWRQEAGGFLPFQAWGVACGMGAMGIIGVVIHPTYGPWNSFRGGIILDAPIEPDDALDDFNPCKKCEAPCMEACPAGAISRDGCNVQKCLGARLFDERCETVCAAREACVYGKDYRFHRDEITYHSFTGIEKIRRAMGH